MAQRIAIFLPNWIGDVVMATPFLRAMHQRYSRDTELIGIARPYVSAVLEGTPWLSRQLLYERKPRPGALSSWQLVSEMRKLQFDHAVLLTNSLRTAALAWLSGAKRRLGYARDMRSWLLTDTLATPRDRQGFKPVPAVDYYLALANELGCPPEPPRVELPVTQEDRTQAELAWRQLSYAPHQQVISLHIAGGWGGKATAKAWPLEHFAELARQIVTQYNREVLVLCGPNEREAARELVRRAGDGRVKSLAEIEKLPLSLTKGCLSRSSLLVTTDSGPRHLATALDVPVVGLFGATDPAWTETYHPRAITLFNKLDCGPCKKQHCPLTHHRCMRELSVDRVLAAVAQQLAHSQRSAA